MQLLTKKIESQLRANHKANEDGTKCFKPIVKLFNPYGVGTWYLSELDDNDIAFGHYFKNNPTLCVSSGTVALALYKDACQIQPRLTELANQGLIKDSGIRGQTKYGRSCILWRYSGKTEEEKTKQDNI